MPVAPEEPGPPDSLRVRDQPALTTSSGRIWLVVGGLFALITVIVLVPMLGLEPEGVAGVGIFLTVGLYLAMVLARYIPAGRLRLGVMATAMIGIAVVALLCIVLIALAEWSAL
jgi:O-antigen/teichoic acid export membrane protein